MKELDITRLLKAIGIVLGLTLLISGMLFGFIFYPLISFIVYASGLGLFSIIAIYNDLGE